MAEISKIQLPSGNVYDLKDATARQLIAQGVAFIMAWDGNSTPVIANIPAGVVVTYNNQSYTGTLAASSSTSGKFYLVKSETQVGDDTLDVFDEYVVVIGGTEQSPTYAWEKIGDTRINLSNIGELAYKNSVTLNKGNGDNVLGEATTFTVSVPTYSATNTNVSATASGTAVGADGTDTFVKSYPGTTSRMATTTIKGVSGTENVSAVTHTSKKLQTTSVPNVTSNTEATLTFTMGDDETLIIGGTGFTQNTYTASNTSLGTAITAATGSLVATSVESNVGGTIVDTVTETPKTVATANADATTVATGSLSNEGGGDSVMTGLGTATTASALTGVKVTQQPTVALATGATAGDGVVSLTNDISSAANTNNVTVGTNDTVKVAKYDDLSVTVS